MLNSQESEYLFSVSTYQSKYPKIDESRDIHESFKRINPQKNVPRITSQIRRLLFHRRKGLWKQAKDTNNQNNCQGSDVAWLKACGPDGVTARCFEKYLSSSGVVPSVTSSVYLFWGCSHVNGKTIFKKGEKEFVCNYKPISFTCIVS